MSARSRRATPPDPGAATRAWAARAVAGVLGGATLDDAFTALEQESLARPERAQVKALAFGALRWHHRHRRLLALLLERPLQALEPLIEALLSVGCFQMLAGRQPEYAVVSATVSAARLLRRPRAAALVNATLRRLQREREALLGAALATEEGRFSHPEWLIAMLRRDWPEEWRSVLEAAQVQPPLWLRVNASREDARAYLARLEAAGLVASGEPHLGEAVRLAEPLPVTDIPGFTAGEVTVQDAGSQLAAGLLAPAAGMRVLDACAAPGGKTTHLLERAAGALELTALDVDAARLERLRANLARLGLAARVVHGDALEPAAWWDGEPFDRILLDAPCSGTGVIRRHPDIKLLRRPGDIAQLAARQLALLATLRPLLRPGGRLLYVTCSILRAENAEVVQGFRAAHADMALAPAAVPTWAAPQPGGGWQILPGRADTDGLYYALMTRE